MNFFDLSDFDTAFLKLIVAGYEDREIAETLNCSLLDVSVTERQLCDKLLALNRVNLVAIVVSLGWIAPVFLSGSNRFVQKSRVESPFTRTFQSFPGTSQISEPGMVSSISERWDELRMYMLADLNSSLAHTKQNTLPEKERKNGSIDQLFEHLTRREQETSLLAAEQPSWTNPRIAIELGISVNTLRNHLRSIYKKLGVGNRGSLVKLILEQNPPQTVIEQSQRLQNGQRIVALFRVLREKITISELKVLCFLLQIDYEQLEQGGKDTKLISLLNHLNSRGGLTSLEQELATFRADISLP